MSGSIGIAGLAGLTIVRAGVRRPGVAGFRVAEEAEAAGEAARVVSVSLPSLLALQEAGEDAVRDREARRHGDSLLDALRELQRAMLGGASAGPLERLQSLTAAMPGAADPRLADVQRALMVRTAVELARARVAASL